MKKMKKAQSGIAATVKKAADKVSNAVKSSAPKGGNPYKNVADLSRTPMQRLLSKDQQMQKSGGKTPKAKGGKQMIKRADGSYSQRGLWDNIRANRGSGKKPTAAMLKQERKIKSKTKK